DVLMVIVGGITVGDIINTAIELVCLEMKTNEEKIQEINRIVKDSTLIQKVFNIALYDIFWDKEYAVYQLKNISIGDFISTILMIFNIDLSNRLVPETLVDNCSLLTIEYLTDGNTTPESVRKILLNHLYISLFIYDTLIALNEKGILTKEQVIYIISNQLLVEFTNDSLNDLIDGKVDFKQKLNDITLNSIFSVPVTVFAVLDKLTIAKYIVGFGLLVGRAKISNLIKAINAQDYDEFIYELFSDNNIFDIYDILAFTGIAVIIDDYTNVQPDEKVWYLLGEVRLAELFTNFVAEELFKQYTIGDYFGELFGWEKINDKYVTGNEQVDNDYINVPLADVINKIFNSIPKEWRLPVFFAAGGLVVTVILLVKDYTIDDVISLFIKVDPSIVNTEFYQAVFMVSLDMIIKNEKAVMDALKALTYGDLIDFIVVLIENIFKIDIDIMSDNMPLLIKHIKVNADQVSILLDTNSDTILKDLIGGVNVAMVFECIMDFAKVNYSVLDKIGLYQRIGDLEIIDMIETPEKTLADLKDITIGDVLDILWVILPDYVPYAALQNLINNFDHVSINDILTAIDSKDFDLLINKMLMNVDFYIILGIPELEKLIPEDIRNLEAYKALATITFIDIIYQNTNALLDHFDKIVIGEIIEFIINKIDNKIIGTYVILQKFIANTKKISVTDLVLVGADYRALAITALGDISLTDIVNTVLIIANVEIIATGDTKVLIDKLFENFDKAYIAYLIQDPTYIPWYEMIDGITVGMLIEGIVGTFYQIPLKYKNNSLYLKIRGILVKDIILHTEDVVNQLKQITVGEIVEGIINCFGKEISQGAKDLEAYKKIANVKIGDIIDLPVETLNNVLTISLGDIVDIVLFVFPEYKPYEMLQTLINNLHRVTILNIKEAIIDRNFDFVLQTALENIDFNIILEIPEIAKVIPAEIVHFEAYRALVTIKLIDLIVFNKEAIKAQLDKVTVGGLLENIINLIDVKVINDYIILSKFINNTKAISASDFIFEPIDVVAMIKISLGDISYADVINTVIKALQITYIVRISTQDLIDKLMTNLDKAYLKDLLNNPIYIGWYEIINDVTIGEVIAGIAELFCILPKEYKNSALIKRIGNILVKDVILHTEDVVNQLKQITVGEIVEGIINCFGKEISQGAKDLEAYKKIANVKIGDIIDLPVETLNNVLTISLGDIVDIVLFVFPEYKPYEMLQTLINNLHRVTILNIKEAIIDRNFDFVLQTALENIDFNIILEIPEIAKVIPAEIVHFEAYRALVTIKLIDLIVFNKEAIKAQLDKVTVGGLLENIINLIDVKVINDYIILSKFINNTKAISASDFIFEPIDVVAMIKISLGDISYADVINTVIKALQITYIVRISTQDLIDKLMTNLDKAYLKDLLNNPIYIGWYEIINDVTIGEVIAGIAELFCILPKEYKNSALIKRIGNILVKDVILHTENVVYQLKQITVGELVDGIVAIFGKEIPQSAKDLEAYRKVQNITIGDIIDLPLNTLDEVMLVSLGDLVDIVLYVFPEYVPYDQLQVLINNLHNIALFDIKKAIVDIRYKPLIKTALENIDFNIILGIAEVAKVIPAEVTGFKAYKVLVSIKLLDLIYFNNEALLAKLELITIGDFIADLLVVVNSTASQDYIILDKFIQNTKSISIGDLIATDANYKDIIIQTLNQISFADIINTIIKAFGITYEVKLSTQNLIDTILANLEKCYITDFIKDPIYIAWRESIDGITLGELFEGIVEIFCVIDKDIKTNSVYVRIAKINLVDLIDAPEKAYDEMMKVTIGELVDILLSAFKNFKPYSTLQILINNLHNVSILNVKDAIVNKDFETVLKMALNGIDFTIITEIKEIADKIPAIVL
ncbi:MAG: hypothetical protein RR054_04290, partial [Clostridia bacterium]